MVDLAQASRLRSALRRVRAWASAPRTVAGSRTRVAAHWAKDGGSWRAGGSLHWTELGQIQRLINQRVSGDPEVDPYDYFIRKYLHGQLPLERALTLGCGTGELERGLAEYGFCRRHDAFDIADVSVRKAREAAARAGLSHIAYDVRDINEIELPAATYDCVWGVH